VLLAIVGAVMVASGCTNKQAANKDKFLIQEEHGGGETVALLIIDIQNDYFEGGKNTLANTLEALSNAEDILAKFRGRGLPVIHIQHIGSPSAGFFLPNTWGVEIHEKLTPRCNETVILKRSPSSFLGTELGELLTEKGISQLVICGMQTNVCVQATTKDTNQFGYQITLLEDACAAINLEIHEKTIEALSEFATVIKTSEYEIPF